jgi:pyruvate/2-oxoglutarate/acetoin dehydrogenase E1 component
MTRMTYVSAAIEALAEEMTRDETVWAVGEDLSSGGVFGQYRGLADRFGSHRIVDTPISEAAIVGAALGAAMLGTRPVVEMRFSDFAMCAMDEVINQTAKARYMLGGQVRVPMVIREPIGMGRSAAAQHSQSLEAWYTHVPGLVVVCPSTPADLRGTLATAIRGDDPVIFMEHKGLWSLDGEVDLNDHAGIPLGRASVARFGQDVTIVSWSAQVHVALDAADRLLEEGIHAEVVDLRTLWPWDKKAVGESVRKTGRLLITHEAVAVAGFGAEVAAWIAEHESEHLRAPVARLGAPRIPIGFASVLEDEARVSASAIADRVKKMVEYR